MIDQIPSSLGYIKAGRLRGLAVTPAKRTALLPELPTIAESGFPGFDATPWFGLMAPAATPPPIIERLHREAAKVLALPDLRKKFKELGLEAEEQAADAHSQGPSASPPARAL